ncbi:MAG TPA: class I fructose-bisphosphate aldolase [Candidatus Limnocylindrales bacterium]|nr:class I fructose-bisphosphate aldolase [Candidatus Limnocylindrales bacterium]
MSELYQVARALVAPGKGILAADESSGTIKRRFDAIGVENSEDNRRAYRELLFRTPGAAEYISGVILYDETIRQTASDGTPLVKILKDQGMIPGIKVDTGAKPLANASGETVTEGLDGLPERFAEYRGLGAKFSKWRAVFAIGEDIPSRYGISVNAHALGRFAALSQQAGIVPIVEPEVLMDGDHTIERCFAVTRDVLRAVFNELADQRVDLDGTLLKPNMVLSGKDAARRAPPEEVARATLQCFRETVPWAVPGIVFLSGGQSDEEATVNLDAINRRAKEVGAPWQLSFSYGRGLQAAPQKAWGGKRENVAAAQRAYRHRAKLTAAARMGGYSPEMEKEAVPA